MDGLKLMPCPFCGHTEPEIDSKRTNGYRLIDGARHEVHTVYVRCGKCHAVGPETTTHTAMWSAYPVSKEAREKAAEAWNRRADGLRGATDERD